MPTATLEEMNIEPAVVAGGSARIKIGSQDFQFTERDLRRLIFTAELALFTMLGGSLNDDAGSGKGNSDPQDRIRGH